MKYPKPIAIDLFCGAGGMSLGFEQAGFDVVAAYDVEEFNIKTPNGLTDVTVLLEQRIKFNGEPAPMFFFFKPQVPMDDLWMKPI